MKVAVTGANGFLGSHLVERLLDHGDEVVAVVRPSASLRWLAAVQERIQVAQATLEDADRLAAALAGADAVVHLAGATRIKPVSRFHDVNVGGTRAVLEACARARPSPRRLVLSSSLAAAGPSAPSRPLTEDQPAFPLSAYGRSKREAEEIVLADDRIEAVALRPTAIYGPRDVDMFQVLALARRGLHVRLGFQTPAYNYLYVSDAADAFIAACHSPQAAGEIFNLGDDTNYTPAESETIMAAAVGVPKRLTLRVPFAAVRVAALVAELATFWQDRPPTLNRDKAQLLTAGSWAIDIAKARELLGFQPAGDLADGLARTVAWYEEAGWFK